MGLEKIASGAGKVAKATGNFLYEAGKGVVKGIGKAIYETGKGVYKGIKKVSGIPAESDVLEESDFSVFFNELKQSNIPKKNYNTLSSLISGKAYNNLPEAYRIEKSLNILDKMYIENYINKRTHKRLKKSLYYEFKRILSGKENYSVNNEFRSSFKDYLPLSASIILLFFGIFLLNPNLTGFSVLSNVVNYKLGIVGIFCFLFSLFFFWIFLERFIKKKKTKLKNRK